MSELTGPMTATEVLARRAALVANPPVFLTEQQNASLARWLASGVTRLSTRELLGAFDWDAIASGMTESDAVPAPASDVLAITREVARGG